MDNAGEHVLPGMVERYTRDQSSISKLFIKLLEQAGIETKKEAGSGRRTSSKSFHALRFTFCKEARLAGVPDAVVASMWWRG